MIEHDEQVDEQVAPDERFVGDEQHTPSGDAQSTPEPNVDRAEPVADANEIVDADEPHAEAEAEVEDEDEVDADADEPEVEPADEDEAADEHEAITDLDDAGDVTPADAVADSLREALGTMREEADRIATLGTGEEQVAASEKFAEDAGKLDEQVGAAARSADDD